MRIFISFQPRLKYDNFEGSRLRKSIKGALEVSSISYTSNIEEEFDIAHFISLDDEYLIHKCLSMHKPVVISALYCETDPVASFLTYKKKKDKVTISLSVRALNILPLVNAILVPTLNAKKFLIEQGINTPIYVVSSGINLARFNYLNEDEKDIFYRYFRESSDKKLAIALGSYSNVNGITTAIHIAENTPCVNFYYFFQGTISSSMKIRRFLKQLPKNFHLEKIPPDDVFRSALVNADYFLYTCTSVIGYITLLEAMGAHSEVIIKKQDLFSDVLVENENVHIIENDKDFLNIIQDLYNGQICPTKEKAFAFASSQGLDVIGEQLVNIYETLCQ